MNCWPQGVGEFKMACKTSLIGSYFKGEGKNDVLDRRYHFFLSATDEIY